MNQGELIQVEDESAFFLPSEAIRKRYTSDQVQGIEWKRNAVLLLVGYGCPVETIARELKMNVRTVQAITAQDGVKVAGFRKEYSQALLRKGAEQFALAGTKAHEASYLQLCTGAGIQTDKALALAAMGEIGEEKTLKERPEYGSVCAELRRLMEGSPNVGTAPAADGHSGDLTPNNGQIDADATALQQAQAPGHPGGGVAAPVGGASVPMHPSNVDFGAKG